MKIVERNLDFVLVVIFTLLSIPFLFINFDTIFTIYQQNNLNEIIINFTGTAFGMLLTAYAILFGLIPSMNKELLETRAFRITNYRFLLAVITTLIIVILSFINFLIEGSIGKILVFLNIVLVIFLILLSFLLTLTLYYVFKLNLK